MPDRAAGPVRTVRSTGGKQAQQVDQPGIGTEPTSGDVLRRAISLTERGMGAVQDILAVLRETDREMLALAERVRHLEQLAWCDELTGLPNLRGLEDQMRREEARALRYGSPAAVALLDIDGLRIINDRHGYSAGDILLRAVGAALRAGARGSDIVARASSDTFIALLPGAEISGAQAFVERVRVMAQYARLPAGEVLPIILIAGTATREEAGSLKAAIELADQRLLLNKQRHAS